MNMKQRTASFKILFGTSFVSLKVSVDGLATLVTTRNPDGVKMSGFDRAEVARMARKLQNVCKLHLAGFSGGMAQLSVVKVAVPSVDLYWDRKGNKAPQRQCNNWRNF